MKDGRTRKLANTTTQGRDGFLTTHRATLVIASGPHGGSEVALAKERITLGRGAGVDVVFDDASISSQHAALELIGSGFRIRDLGSTNGVRVNGSPALSAELKHGDRIQIGALALRYVVETRAAQPPTHDLDED
jgi:pSer/pThr/pTyr-binding forkhead associated (FHA) protein